MKTSIMFNQFLHTAKAAVHDINNYLKTNAEICMDFMLRLNGQVNPFEPAEADQPGGFQRLATLHGKYDLAYGEAENFGCLEENY